MIKLPDSQQLHADLYPKFSLLNFPEFSGLHVPICEIFQAAFTTVHSTEAVPVKVENPIPMLANMGIKLCFITFRFDAAFDNFLIDHESSQYCWFSSYLSHIEI